MGKVKAVAVQAAVQVETQVQAICDSERTRYSLGHIELRPGSKADTVWLAATDGRCGAVVRADGHSASVELVPGKLLPKRTPKAGAAVELTDEWRCGNTHMPYEPEDLRFPDMTQVLPTIHSADAIVLSLNAQLLKQVADAIVKVTGLNSCGAVSLVFNKDNLKLHKDGMSHLAGPLVIVATNPEDQRGIGVLMPVDTEGNPLSCYEEMHREFVADYKK